MDSRTVICVLTHDPKFDVPVLEVALRTPAGYIGAMGSRRTHEDRLARLREAGLSEDELARLRSPIGLDLGRPDARGDRGVGRRRADPAPLGRLRPAADRDLRADPSLSAGGWPRPAGRSGRADGRPQAGPSRQAAVAGVLLAAGAGSRLGRPKALVELGGVRLVDRGIWLLRAGGAAPLVVVTGAAQVTLPPG